MKLVFKKNILILLMLIAFYLFNTQNADASENKYILVLTSLNLESYNQTIEGFKTGFNKNDFNYEIKVFKMSTNWKNIQEIMMLLKSNNKPVLIFTLGLRAASFAVKFAGNIPVIFTLISDWQKNFLNKKNITGISLEIDAYELFKYAYLINPEIKKIGIIYNKEKNEKFVNNIKDVFTKNNIDILLSEIKSQKTSSSTNAHWSSLKKLRHGYSKPSEKTNETDDSHNELEKNFNKIKDKIEFLFIIPDEKIINSNDFSFLVTTCQNRKIPALTFSEKFFREGALASIIPNYFNIGAHANLLARKILNRGITPDKLHVSSPYGSKILLNSSVSNLLGLNMDLLEKYVDTIH